MADTQSLDQSLATLKSQGFDVPANAADMYAQQAQQTLPPPGQPANDGMLGPANTGSVGGTAGSATPANSGVVTSDQVSQLYQSQLGRTPSQNEINAWVNAGTDLNTLTNAVKGSQEYISDHPTSQPATQQNVATIMGAQASHPVLPSGTQIQATNITPQANEFTTNPTVNPTGVQAQTTRGQLSTASADAITQAQQQAQQVGQYQAVTNNGNIPQAQAAQGTLNPLSTVQGQYSQLMQGFQNGQVPEWAAPAVAAANEQMAARGLGASTMAGAATVAAAMQAALPIAVQDAQTNAQMQFQNLNNEQQANITNTNNQFQALLTDQSVQNAALQFNAQNQSQVAEYFGNLQSQMAQFNAYQTNAMSEFNSGQENAMSQFNANMQDMRERFNAQNQLVVDQSNATWRRQINTANTATNNAVNQENATNLLNISNTDMNNIWQAYRDNASWAFQQSQNQSNQAANLAMASLNNNANMQYLNQQQLNNMASSVGAVAMNILGNYLTH